MELGPGKASLLDEAALGLVRQQRLADYESSSRFAAGQVSRSLCSISLRRPPPVASLLHHPLGVVSARTGLRGPPAASP